MSRPGDCAKMPLSCPMLEYRDYMQEERPRSRFGLGSATQVFIALNVAVYFTYLLLVYLVLPYLVQVRDPRLPERVLGWFGLVPSSVLDDWQIWQLVTYSFFHAAGKLGFLHLVLNMWALYFFGGEVETIYGRRRFVALYLLSTTFAGLSYCLFKYDVERSILMGSASAVYAVLVVYAIHFPFQRVLAFFLLPMPVWALVAVLIGLDLASELSGEGGSLGYLAHLGGALFGWLFYALEGRVEQYLDRLDRRAQRARREHEEELEAKLDTLLEKISHDGMDSLSKKEREFLKRASVHYQKKS